MMNSSNHTAQTNFYSVLKELKKGATTLLTLLQYLVTPPQLSNFIINDLHNTAKHNKQQKKTKNNKIERRTKEEGWSVVLVVDDDPISCLLFNFVAMLH